ncbi:winged helix DNA-binding domain-containing protein [Listeria booriae]|uniref:DNA glycosylase AlkZ-like family protein n=1 Tax=Listeria booriae TaxID=1552123 RepID=UPI001624CE9F|nr:crosslink repair DNA glycosylase YcaQ family protein [Listeria booriae]MBC2367562.1 winged helix DNA-binding domain-containing protein [Listeria booriae]
MFTKAEITQIRLKKLGMCEPFSEPKSFMKRTIALQSQNHQPALVNFVQHVSMTWEDAEAFFESQQVVKIWANRLTLHTFLAEDWEMVFRVFGTQRNIVHRICEKEGLDLEAILAEIDVLTRSKEIVNRKELEAIIGDYSAQVRSSIIAQAAIRGILYLLPSSDTIRNYSHRSRLGNYTEWAPDEAKDLEAMKALIHRYLAGYGPATWKDFRHWSGLTVGNIKEAVKALANELVVFTLDGEEYVALRDEKVPDTAQNVFLTGKFDQAVIAYKDPTWIMTEAQRKSAWTVNGHCSAIIVAANRAIGLWKYEWKKGVLIFTVSYFESACFQKEIKNELERFASRISPKPLEIQYNLG